MLVVMAYVDLHAERIGRAGASTVSSRRLARGNPRVPPERGNAAGPVGDLVAWRSQHETRIRAAIAAARLRR